MYQHRDYPEKSWSPSRLQDFSTCPRRYYYNTFGQWNGWEFSALEHNKLIYRLRKLQNAYTLSGSLLHEEINRSLQNKAFNAQESYQNIRKGLNKAVSQSLHQRSAWEARPTKLSMLHEYYYGEGVSKEFGGRINSRIEQCLQNFTKTEAWQLLSAGKAQIVESEETSFPHFIWRDYKVYCIIDLLYEYQGQYYIVDWKSGQPDEENRQQMAIYALYVLSRYRDVTLDQIHCVNEYLLSGERQVYNFTSEDISACRELLDSSIEAMERCLVDVALNKPHDEGFFVTKPSYQCRNCNFIQVCPDAPSS